MARMKRAALVPVRSFARAKRRLRARFASQDVDAIQRALLADVLAALHASTGLDHVGVLTGDRDVAEAARESGAAVHWLDPDPGLNAALEAAAQRLRADGFDALLVVLGDLPLLRGGDVDAVLEAGLRHPLVGVPSLDGGTALLYQSPPGRLGARFGPESFEAHRSAAREQGAELLALDLPDPDARCDLDTPEDARRIAASARTTCTVALLRKLGA
jgi:2-phospho-L-lactate guanylyltransferase